MWISEKRWFDLNNKLSALEARVNALDDKVEDSSKMRITTKDYEPMKRELGFCGGFFRPEVGEAKDVPIEDIVRQIADKAGIEISLKPSEPAKPAEVVIKKRRKK